MLLSKNTAGLFYEPAVLLSKNTASLLYEPVVLILDHYWCIITGSDVISTSLPVWYYRFRFRQ